MEMMRVPSARGEWAMTTSRPASKPKVISRSSPYSKRRKARKTPPRHPRNSGRALRDSSGSSLRPIRISIPECSSFCSYKQAHGSGVGGTVLLACPTAKKGAPEDFPEPARVEDTDAKPCGRRKHRASGNRRQNLCDPHEPLMHGGLRSDHTCSIGSTRIIFISGL
jgi:hypothetical protein